MYGVLLGDDQPIQLSHVTGSELLSEELLQQGSRRQSRARGAQKVGEFGVVGAVPDHGDDGLGGVEVLE